MLTIRAIPVGSQEDGSVTGGINCYENVLYYKLVLNWDFCNMNLMNMMFALCFLINVTSAERLRAKANMRGIVTKFSGLSPRQIQMIKRILKLEQKIQYGRFA